MARPFNKERPVSLLAKLLLGLALLLLPPLVVAQNNLGELLDAGARKLSGEEFRQDVVQHTIVGTTASGQRLELMYATSGVIQGRSEANAAGTNIGAGINILSALDGAWTIDESGKICASMVIQRVILPFRCQYWFKYKD